MRLYIPPRQHMQKTSNEDAITFYYWPGIRYLYLKRLANTLELLGEGPYHKLLEIGYGSGIALPELSQRCQQLYGVDIHKNVSMVEKSMKKEKIQAILSVGNILCLDFEDAFFDAVVSVSVLEHIQNLDKAVGEIHRVLKQGGQAVLSFPVRNIITDTFFRMVGFKPREIHPSSHQDILSAVSQYFDSFSMLNFPKFLPHDIALYTSIMVDKFGF